ncbi:helix-turn-helix transcriptional regulator [Prauserella cavernicola]|uniref:helix-turn-helix transcriptional regulator n=1 Tax=Prauserella cavernicola TaxID=2800127 RepID=UPI0027DC4C9E|nr:response regulator transcription factor [Prauserella cavernicola]
MAVAVHATDPITRLGAANILGGDGRVKVLADDELARAEVVVVIEQSVSDGTFAFLRDLRAASRLDPPPRCVIVTDNFRPDALMSAVECGMSAVLQRGTTGADELVRAVLAVSEGSAYLPPRLQGTLLAHLDRMRRDVLEPHGFTLSGLSGRERDVLRLLAEGNSTGEIAAELAYSESTVKNVLYGLMRRHGLTTRAHAVAFALRGGLI